MRASFLNSRHILFLLASVGFLRYASEASQLFDCASFVRFASFVFIFIFCFLRARLPAALSGFGLLASSGGEPHAAT